jgi:predicted DNA-binding transcriptional regulator AlpA
MSGLAKSPNIGNTSVPSDHWHAKGAQPSAYRRITPRGLSRIDAAGYVGVSPSLFDEMVKDGRMPQPIRINARVVWDVRELDAAFGDLKEQPKTNPWDAV